MRPMTRPLAIDDLYVIPALSEPTLSPDGTTVAYVVTTPDRDADGYRSQVWTVAADGSSEPRAFTNGPHDSSPRWAPDGSRLAFVADDGDGVAQVHLVDAAGGAARQLTRLAAGAGDPQWAPDGSRIAVTSVISLSTAPAANAPVVIDRLG